jgi:hypothetical protein
MVNIDGRQFLKEARELHEADKERFRGVKDVSDVVKGWGANDLSLDTFKRTLCHYTDNSGHVTNYLHAILNCRPISEIIVASDAMKGPWNEEQRAVIKRADDECDSWFGRMDLYEIYTLELVLKHFDEIVKRFKQRFAEEDAIDELNKALRKYPKANCEGDMGAKVNESISLYNEISCTESDIERYKKMIDIGKTLVTDNTELMQMLTNSVNARSKRIKQLAKDHGNAETNIHDALLNAMKGKFIYWDEGKTQHSRYMRLDDVNMDGWSDKAVYLKGPLIYFDWGIKPKFEANGSVYLSYMSNLSDKVDCLHIVEIDELLKEVEKHTPFMLDFIKKLTENMA